MREASFHFACSKVVSAHQAPLAPPTASSPDAAQRRRVGQQHTGEGGAAGEVQALAGDKGSCRRLQPLGVHLPATKEVDLKRKSEWEQRASWESRRGEGKQAEPRKIREEACEAGVTCQAGKPGQPLARRCTGGLLVGTTEPSPTRLLEPWAVQLGGRQVEGPAVDGAQLAQAPVAGTGVGEGGSRGRGTRLVSRFGLP